MKGTVNVGPATPQSLTDYIKKDQIGAAEGVAPLDENKKLPAENLPALMADNIGFEDGSTLQDKLDNEELGGGGALVASSHTLSASDWALGSDERYYQTVSVEGVTTDESQVIVVDPALTGTDLEADAAVLEAWQEPSGHNVTQGDGTLTFYAYTAPTVNIPINVGVA